MKVIAITSQKGGTGKTTLSGHLAVQAARAGAGSVALVDSDPQGSLTQWWNTRRQPTPAFVQTSISTLARDLGKLADDDTEFVFIDTPPAITFAIVEVIKVSDLVVIPVRPSPHDLAATGTTVDMVERISRPMVFAINGASPRARITGEAAVALSQHGTVAPVTIHQRTEFAASMIDGRTVMELPRAARSSAEITALWDYLAPRLERLPARHSFRPQIIDELADDIEGLHVAHGVLTQGAAE